MTFFDTNVLVYLFDDDAPEKRRVARERFAHHARAGDLALSTQVLQEFYVTVTRKLARPLEPNAAAAVLDDLCEQHVVAVDPATVRFAARLHDEHGISFWDALIVETAVRAGALTLLSEDLQDGRGFGNLAIENPFAATT